MWLHLREEQAAVPRLQVTVQVSLTVSDAEQQLRPSFVITKSCTVATGKATERTVHIKIKQK